MRLLLRAVVTGFGLSIGAFAFKKLVRRLGLEPDDKKDDEASKVTTRDGATDPGLRDHARADDVPELS
jgi:hypothetical protein